MSTVLVTGGSGFLGSHIVLKLLAAGHSVRTTLRSPQREISLGTLLAAGGATGAPTVAIADLNSDAGWDSAVAGCEYVVHVASPFPAAAPRHDDELITPARAGTLRVLRAARAAGVRRVVLTSSFAAIGYGHAQRDAPFDESHWSNLHAVTSAYVKSKTLAERAAWDFVAGMGAGLQLAVINPVAVFGPVLGADFSSSILLVKLMLEGKIPAFPKLYFGVVDVRDVADLHVTAMTHPAADGERFLATAGEALSLQSIARLLKSRLGSAGARIGTRQLPDWLVRIAALASANARQALPELGLVKHGSPTKAKRLLGWTPRSSEEALLATAHSLLALRAQAVK